MRVQVYSLLHIEPKEFSRVNLQKSSFEKSIEIYFRNALTLQKSLEQIGLEFNLLTNDAQYLKNHFPTLISRLNILEIEFTFPSPKGVKFYSSHHVLDVFHFLSQTQHSYLIYLDLDVIAINQLNAQQIEAFTSSKAIALDHTIHSIDEWKYEMYSDLLLTRGKSGAVKWYGGEFLSGDKEFFKAITGKIQLLTNNYLSSIEKIFHKGMETLLTAALLELEDEGWKLYDATSYSLIVRIWEMPFKKQNEFYRTFKNFTFIHLPGHKEWLSELSSKEFHVNEIFRKFRKKSNSRLIARAIKRLKKIVTLSVGIQ